MEAAVATEAPPTTPAGYIIFPHLHPCFACRQQRKALKKKKGEYFCQSCLRSTTSFDPTSSRYRWNLSQPELLSSPTPTHALPSNLGWGIECEVDFHETPKREYMKKLLTQLQQKTVFGAHGDGSLAEGIEFYSPILSGDRGVTELKKFCTYAQFLPITDRCGLHLHLDARKLEWTQIHQIYWIYAIVEPELFKMLPARRRKNIYCVRMHSSHRKLLPKVLSSQDFNLVYSAHCSIHRLSPERKSQLTQEYKRRGGNRNFHYDGINLSNYWEDHSDKKTIEIRYHSGTVEFEKIYHWLVLNLALVKLAFLQPEEFKQELPKRASETRRFIKKILDTWPQTLQYIEGRWKKFVNE